MCTEQKYNEGANYALSNEQTVNVDRPTAGTTLTPPRTIHPAIPAYALDLDPQLRESITAIQTPDRILDAPPVLNAIYAAFELGRKMATPDEPALPSVLLQLATIPFPDQQSNRSEMELVVSALTQAISHPSYAKGEHDMLLTMLECLQMDIFDVIARLYSQTKTGASK